MLSLLLVACTSPENAASAVALQYATVVLVDPAAQHALACAEDRDAKPVDALAAEILQGKSVLGDAAFAKYMAEDARRTLAVATLSLDKKQATVILSAPHDAAKPDALPATFNLVATDAGWCVATGWALDKKVKASLDAGLADATAAQVLIADWRFDEAEAKVAEEEATVAEIPADRVERATADTNVTALRTLLTMARAGWVGGRWRVTEDMDPMTDAKNVIARLESTDGLPDMIGTEKHATLIARCNRGTLDLYIATDSMLDADWQYDSVTGQYRFDAEPPAKLSGSRSTDYKAMFLRNPISWLEKLSSHEGATWAVELPLFRRKPATVHFNLDSATVALARVPKECR